MSAYNINDEDMLLKLEHYELYRGDGRILIRVGTVLAGKAKCTCVAVPNLLLTEAKEQYLGYGESATEALNDCLNKIKGVPVSEIIEGGVLPEDFEMTQ